jgi:uncharacterized protein YbcV (DUF1398 family)
MMDTSVRTVVEACSRGSESGGMGFGEVLQKLAGAGVEGYYADFRRSMKTYYLPGGEVVEVPANDPDRAISAAFDASRVESAVRQSQAGTHTYRDFCEKVMAAGCSGYLVSLLGRRVVYFGRTAETHVEHFPS